MSARRTIVLRIFSYGGRKHRFTDTVNGGTRKAVRKFRGDPWAAKKNAGLKRML